LEKRKSDRKCRARNKRSCRFKLHASKAIPTFRIAKNCNGKLGNWFRYRKIFFYYALASEVYKTVEEIGKKTQEIADSYKGEQVWKPRIIAKFLRRIKCWDLERLIGTPCLTDADIIKHFCAAVDDILENDWTVNHSKHIKLYKAKECEYMARVSFDQVIPLLALKKEYGEEWFWKHLFKDYKPFVWKN
jgi:hypothetical protein